MGKVNIIYSIPFLLLLASCSLIENKRMPSSTETCQENGIGCPFLNIAHRGAAYEAAENTIPAFDAAMKQGANALEIDLVITAEHEVVVYHDRDPNALISLIRQAGLEGQKYIPYNPKLFSKDRVPVEELTLDELRRIYGYALRKGIFRDIFGGAEKDEDAYIPTIDEFASWGDQQDRLEAVFLDIKLVPGQEGLVPVMAERLARVFAKSKYRIYMLTQYESIYIAFQRWINVNPKVPNRFLTLDMEKEGALSKRASLKNKLKKPVRSLALGSTILRSWDKYLVELEDVLNQSRRRRDMVYPVVSWTVDNERRLYRLLQMGVDGILTNRPDHLNRLVNRHWKDHSMAAKFLAACQERAKHEGSGIICASGTQIAPFAPIGQQEITNWVCSERNVHSTLRDYFGCDGLLDKVNIKFNTTIEDDASVLLVTSLDGVKVLKFQRAPTENEAIAYIKYDQKKCNDGILNSRCEYKLELEQERGGAWHSLGVSKSAKDSFGAYFFVPKDNGRLRLRISETDDGKVDDQAVVTFVQGDAQFAVAGAKKRFQGQIKVYLHDASKFLKRPENLMDLALEFDQKDCFDGVLNFKCEYKVVVEAMDAEGKLVKVYGHDDSMKDSFVVYAQVPIDIQGLKITVKEMDEEKVSAQTQFILGPHHGSSMEIDSGDGTFSGNLTVKHFDYDEATQGSEGEKDANPHSQKNREHKNLRELRMP